MYDDDDDDDDDVRIFIHSLQDFGKRTSERSERVSFPKVIFISGPITSTRTTLILDLFSYGFPKKLRAGPYGYSNYDSDSDSVALSAAVLYQLSYEDRYVRSRPIYRVHLYP